MILIEDTWGDHGISDSVNDTERLEVSDLNSGYIGYHTISDSVQVTGSNRYDGMSTITGMMQILSL